MNRDELKKRIESEMPDLLNLLHKQDLPTGTIFVTVKQTWYDSDTDECESVDVSMELVELIDDTWALEDMFLAGESVMYEKNWRPKK